MTDREICEKIIKMGDCITDTSCGNCFLNIDCDEASINPDIKTNCAVYAAKKYLADHPADNEWKPLEVDNLPSDILTGDYEFEPYNHNSGKYDIYHEHLSLLLFSKSAKNGEIRYRKRQPEVKSVEEMAEEYCNDKYGEMPEYPITIKDIHKLLKVEKWTASKDAYIAGYKVAKC